MTTLLIVVLVIAIVFLGTKALLEGIVRWVKNLWNK